MSSKTLLDSREMVSSYQEGLSIDEIASKIGRSYSFARNKLVEAGTPLRSKAEGTRIFISRHPEWSKQFIRYHVDKAAPLTEEKALLLTLIITEGYADETSFGFTNIQESLHSEFSMLMGSVYGNVRMGRNKITTRGSSTEISSDIANHIPNKTFGKTVLDFILQSQTTAAKVLRIVANTEGSMIITVRKGPRNFTTESRIVLASSNMPFTEQLSKLLNAVGIRSNLSKAGIIIGKKEDMIRFIKTIGFSKGVNVVRKKAGMSIWYGYEKRGLTRLYLRIVSEQRNAKSKGMRGAFADCVTKAETVGRLRTWYEESKEVVPSE